jgi:ADP-ribosylglycohydrolase
MANMYLDGIMGLVVGDALGVPVEFEERERLKKLPVKFMEGYGTYDLPAGSWSDDSSMAIATLDSLRNGYNPDDIMQKFVAWSENGEYTPYGECFDIGTGTSYAIWRYMQNNDIHTCGGTKERDNGNGSLMRILPICLYCIDKDFETEEAVEKIHEVSALTHAHIRSKIACGLYYFIVRSIIKNSGSLEERIQSGIDDGFAYYESDIAIRLELMHYGRLRSMSEFKATSEDEIKSSGYVVAAFEAALWCLVNTNGYADCELKAVNLGDDTDTVAAISGGLAGLYYGYDAIPDEWLGEIAKRDWIEDLCKNFKC